MQILRNSVRFEDIFHRYKDRMYSYVLTIVKAEEAAEEVTQEIFIKIWLCREMLDQVDNLDAYIFVIARNKALDHLRKAAYDVKLLNTLKAFMPDEENNVEDRMTAKDHEIIVQQAIDTLSPQRKKVYQLSRIGGFNHDEIADQLQLSKNTVKNHLVEALRQIRQHLYKNGGLVRLLAIYTSVEILFHLFS